MRKNFIEIEKWIRKIIRLNALFMGDNPTGKVGEAFKSDLLEIQKKVKNLIREL